MAPYKMFIRGFLLLPALLHVTLVSGESYEDTHIRFAAFGDSWTSGLNYGPPDHSIEFDKGSEECRCRRVNEAYAVQLLRDHDDWANGRTPELDFQACHGAVFDDIPDQLKRLNQSHPPNFATLTIGGNPGGFFEIVMDCIFQSDPWHSYGPEFPDPDGKCAKSLEDARQRMESDWFKEDLLTSMRAILSEPRIDNDPDFRLYVLSYAALFNEDDPACDEQSFGLWPWKKPSLTRNVRKEINAVIHSGRALLKRLIDTHNRNSNASPPRIVFVDVDPAFAGHRFCEPVPDGTRQEDKSWIYALEWPTCFPIDDISNLDPRKLNGTHFGSCRSCGDFMQLGEVQRPFHPKPEGHLAMERVLKDAVVRENREIERRRRMFLGLPRPAGIAALCLTILGAILGVGLAGWMVMELRKRDGGVRLE